MLPAEVVPSDEDRLHCLMVTERLAVGVGQSRKASALHPHSQVDSLDMAGANLRGIWIAVSDRLFSAYYLGR
jgi:hypothetical protein